LRFVATPPLQFRLSPRLSLLWRSQKHRYPPLSGSFHPLSFFLRLPRQCHLPADPDVLPPLCFWRGHARFMSGLSGQLFFFFFFCLARAVVGAEQWCLVLSFAFAFFSPLFPSPLLYLRFISTFHRLEFFMFSSILHEPTPPLSARGGSSVLVQPPVFREGGPPTPLTQWHVLFLPLSSPPFLFGHIDFWVAI